MSLSDKHEGKILVPWFCSQEWKHVYHLIYSENSTGNTKQEALEILKIWKTRQVLLSSGVEGTLIILSALLLEQNNLNEENICLLYATSIMRFLNLCAANNKKQGTFYETARRNNLPDWLITIRHDLAHDQKVPSKFMLQYCLNYCLDWLKKEYWDAQYGIIRDFVALNKIGKKQNIEKFIVLYEDVVLDVLKRGVNTLAELSSDTVEKLYAWFKSSNLNEHSSISYVLLVLSKAVVPTVTETRRVEFAEYLAKELIKRGTIFGIRSEDICETDGEVLIPDKFLQLWKPVIQRLCEHKMSLVFLKLLFNITMDENSDCRIKEISAVWLNTILNIAQESEDTAACEDFKMLQNEVLKFPNSFTLIFVERLLSANRCTRDYISAVKSLLKSYTQTNGSRKQRAVHVHTVNEVVSMLNTVDVDKNNETKDTQLQPVLNGFCKKWCLIEGTSEFAGCPLGVLPNQKRTRNPLL